MTDTPVPINELPELPCDTEGPVFNEPWEAQSFALAVRLSETGYFTWSEWVEVFSQEIMAAQERGDPDLGSTYLLPALAQCLGTDLCRQGACGS